ncbi:hypothetical protein ANN_24229 [Periplaneta americana]|uniref:Uncharacterized protein n=1 Tax=Periplaneta americana TaxID=6978 RepID=A0ABQ8S2I3_PERAM|nr:hypothetical protein ANN_24229 [Periplaneta americana]
MSPGSSTESYPAFAHIGLRENPGKNLNQVTCPDRESNPGHLVSRPDALAVTPQLGNERTKMANDTTYLDFIEPSLPKTYYLTVHDVDAVCGLTRVTASHVARRRRGVLAGIRTPELYSIRASTLVQSYRNTYGQLS